MNRKDVDEKVNKSYHGCESFFSTVVDGYVVFAVMEYFGMTSPDGNPTQNVPGADGSQLIKKVGEMVDKFVLLEVQPKKILLQDALRNEDHQRYRCRYPGCDKVYVQEKRRDNHEVNVHAIHVQDQSQREAHQIQEMRMAYSTTHTTFLRQAFF